MVRAEKAGSVYTYVYNGDGLLVSETIDGAEAVFTWDLALDVPQVLATSDGTKNLYGLERIGVEQGGAWRYTLADALGSVRQWTDPAGGVLGVQSYGPFGEPRGRVGTPPWGFTGEWQDPAGMVYLRARWYSPALGRFTQVDPVAGDLMAPATQHPYSYAFNSPLTYVDPSGEVTVCLGISGFYGMGAGGEGFFAVCFDTAANVGGRFSTAVIGVAGAGGSLGVTLAVSDAETIYDLEGLASCGGGSYGEGEGLGFEISTGSSPITGQQVWDWAFTYEFLTGRGPLPVQWRGTAPNAEFHGGGVRTWVWATSGGELYEQWESYEKRRLELEEELPYWARHPFPCPSCP